MARQDKERRAAAVGAAETAVSEAETRAAQAAERAEQAAAGLRAAEADLTAIKDQLTERLGDGEPQALVTRPRGRAHRRRAHRDTGLRRRGDRPA